MAQGARTADRQAGRQAGSPLQRQQPPCQPQEVLHLAVVQLLQWACCLVRCVCACATWCVCSPAGALSAGGVNRSAGVCGRGGSVVVLPGATVQAGGAHRIHHHLPGAADCAGGGAGGDAAAAGSTGGRPGSCSVRSMVPCLMWMGSGHRPAGQRCRLRSQHSS